MAVYRAPSMLPPIFTYFYLPATYYLSLLVGCFFIFLLFVVLI